jgi:hypothetical protein
MGMNYYALKTVPVSRKKYAKQIKALADSGDFDSINEIIREYNSKIEANKVHLGKSSIGWKFIFNHNFWDYYDYTEESIRAFMNDCWAIVDEEDKPISVSCFWEKVHNKADGLDDYSYWKRDHPNCVLEYTSPNEAHYCKNVEIPNDLDYRFSAYTEFS